MVILGNNANFRAMRYVLITLMLLLCQGLVWGQVSYTGTIDRYNIELVAEVYSDGAVNVIYEYTKHHEPIVLEGRITGKTLTLYESDKQRTKTAKLVFPAFNKKATTLSGTWTDLKTNKEATISLTRNFDVEEDNTKLTWNNREIIQSAALKNQYFKLIIGKEKVTDELGVKGVKIMDKKTGQLVQQIKLDCQLSGAGLYSVSVGDYNFDGYPDFSVFETGYAEPNTSSLYFLYNPATKKFFKSRYEGVSLEFDEDTKTITELNQCCAGAQQTVKKYKVVNNKMVLKEQHCYKYDEQKQDMVERPMKECE